MELADHKKRLETLKSQRSTWESHWQEIVDYLMPAAQGFTTTYTEGEKRLAYIYDSTGEHALKVFHNSLAGLFTNPATPWFGLGVEREDLNESHEVKSYLARVEQVFQAVFAKSNFYGEIRKIYRDFGGLGTAILYSEPHPRTMVNFTTLHLGDNYLVTNRYGQIDTDYRLFWLTAKQIAEQWSDPGSKVSEALEKNRSDERFQVCQAVWPRKIRQHGAQDAKNKPWASVYFIWDDLHQLQESGYNEFPFAVARSEVMTGEVYGRSLGMVALPDVKMLNRIEQDKVMLTEKNLDLPLTVSQAALINPIETWPGSINIMNAATPGAAVAALPVGNLAYAEKEAEDKRQQIRQTFFNDLMNLIEAPNMTATEVLERAQEKMRGMGGILGDLQAGLFNPLFDRIFQICFEEGYLPPPPRVLQGEALEIDFISPLAKAQKAYELRNIKAGLGALSEISAVKPEVWDLVNLEEVSRGILEMSGFNVRFLNSKEVVTALREARQQEQGLAQAAALAQAGAQALPQMGKGIEPQSPLALLMAPEGMEPGPGSAT